MRINLTDSKHIDVNICRKNIKNIILKVYTDGTVKLSVPTFVTEDEIRSFLIGKREWLSEHLDKQKDVDYAQPRFWHLGKPFNIAVYMTGSERIRFEDDKVIINFKFLRHPLLVFDKWWRKKAEITCKQYIKKWMPIFREYGVKTPDVSIRKMKTLWGSCTPQKNKIRFNYYLLAAPEECIDYIALHEMTHLLHPNHGERFHAFVSKHMPDWQEKKKILNSYPYIADMQNIERILKNYLNN